MSTGIATALKVSNELTILTRIKQVNCLIPMIGLFLCADVLANECAITEKSSLPESIFLPEARGAMGRTWKAATTALSTL